MGMEGLALGPTCGLKSHGKIRDKAASLLICRHISGKKMEAAAVTSFSSIFPLYSTIRTTPRSSTFLSLRSLTSFPSPLPTSFPHLSSPGNSVSLLNRSLCTATRSHMEPEPPVPPFQGAESFFRNVLGSMETVYLNRNPTAKSVLELVRSVDNDRICYDHLAFRTFGGPVVLSSQNFPYGHWHWCSWAFAKNIHLGASCRSDESASSVFTYGLGLGSRVVLFITVSGDGYENIYDNGFPQPNASEEIIRKYTEISGSGNKHAALASAQGFLTWEKPLYSEFQQLARESEYAAWTLVNGYAVNHVTISTHQLKSHLRNIEMLNQFIEENGFKLNSEGGVLKVSPDGLLLQSSTVADSVSFQFSDGVTESVPCSYIEFAERLVLPQYKNLPDKRLIGVQKSDSLFHFMFLLSVVEACVKEYHRRDGFEVGNADKIFESTSKDQLTRRAA
ncbi:hypothetical protein CK203_048980 [Vitis vinifera]|uniref:2-oxoadipate dioxygenase/decarboxylase n=1 Tax=Vitis vinifera TaxID=29760 RepID=A0A438HD92_VITVI|nr:hypothetical protein CK203_048980 [Vitis vinifera]